ncbi:ribosome-binding factor A [Candidatus Desantisbacteria bacterium CG1_02_49_89]|nr:MAG: ribosome-binding factor A [Candidatus Desantisbacteria bacterium CG1_02_49_89]
MSARRMERINEFIKREICFLLQRETKDPRIGFVTVLSCSVTPDLTEARIYISVLGTKKQKADTMAGLDSAAPFMRSQLGKHIALRYTPKVTFFLDETEEKAARIEELLEKIKNP